MVVSFHIAGCQIIHLYLLGSTNSTGTDDLTCTTISHNFYYQVETISVTGAVGLVHCVVVAVKCGTADSSRRGHILMCLRDLVATNECHKAAINRLFSSPQFAHLQVPQLYKETFVGISDDAQQKRGSDKT